jgi:predicted HTH domain antitoxin
MMNATLLDDVLYASRMTEDELRTELAVMLYQRGKVSLGWAAEFCSLNRVRFQHLLASREIPINYDQAALEQDLATVDALVQGM